MKPTAHRTRSLIAGQPHNGINSPCPPRGQKAACSAQGKQHRFALLGCKGSTTMTPLNGRRELEC
jgi:hypothetical protein